MIERKKVDFPSGHSAGSERGGDASASASARAARRAAPRAPRAPMTAQEQAQAKLKREKLMDEFHGRVAGIKHNVDALNTRLSDFEEKVHKEDAKLQKGNPDDFEVDLT